MKHFHPKLIGTAALAALALTSAVGCKNHRARVGKSVSRAGPRAAAGHARPAPGRSSAVLSGRSAARDAKPGPLAR